MTTRRQHYVWRHYLEAWGVPAGKDFQIQCLRKGKTEPFAVGTKNVAVERDFYRLNEFSPADAQFVRKLALRPETNPILRTLAEGWISQFGTFLQLIARLKALPNLDGEGLRMLEDVLIETQEVAYEQMESRATGHMDQLRAGDNRFFEDDEQATSFCYFLAHQALRTKATRDGIRVRFPTVQHDLFDRTWPVLRFVFATNVCHALYIHRKAQPLRVVYAPTGTELITSDQPVINTYHTTAQATDPPEKLEFFYPVSPHAAVLIGEQRDSSQLHGHTLSSTQVSELNAAVQRVAHEQVFALNRASLEGRSVGS